MIKKHLALGLLLFICEFNCNTITLMGRDHLYYSDHLKGISSFIVPVTQRTYSEWVTLNRLWRCVCVCVRAHAHMCAREPRGQVWENQFYIVELPSLPWALWKGMWETAVNSCSWGQRRGFPSSEKELWLLLIAESFCSASPIGPLPDIQMFCRNLSRKTLNHLLSQDTKYLGQGSSPINAYGTMELS